MEAMLFLGEVVGLTGDTVVINLPVGEVSCEKSLYSPVLIKEQDEGPGSPKISLVSFNKGFSYPPEVKEGTLVLVLATNNGSFTPYKWGDVQGEEQVRKIAKIALENDCLGGQK